MSVFNFGELGLVKVGEFPMWPVRRADLIDAPTGVRRYSALAKKGFIVVFFFGCQDFGWVLQDSVRQWDESLTTESKSSVAAAKLHQLALEEAYEWQKEVLKKKFPSRRSTTNAESKKLPPSPSLKAEIKDFHRVLKKTMKLSARLYKKKNATPTQQALTALDDVSSSDSSSVFESSSDQSENESKASESSGISGASHKSTSTRGRGGKGAGRGRRGRPPRSLTETGSATSKTDDSSRAATRGRRKSLNTTGRRSVNGKKRTELAVQEKSSSDESSDGEDEEVVIDDDVQHPGSDDESEHDIFADDGVNDESQMDVDQSTAAASDQTEGATVPMKRRPGRPPKHRRGGSIQSANRVGRPRGRGRGGLSRGRGRGRRSTTAPSTSNAESLSGSDDEDEIKPQHQGKDSAKAKTKDGASGESSEEEDDEDELFKSSASIRSTGIANNESSADVVDEDEDEDDGSVFSESDEKTYPAVKSSPTAQESSAAFESSAAALTSTTIGPASTDSAPSEKALVPVDENSGIPGETSSATTSDIKPKPERKRRRPDLDLELAGIITEPRRESQRAEKLKAKEKLRLEQVRLHQETLKEKASLRKDKKNKALRLTQATTTTSATTTNDGEGEIVDIGSTIVTTNANGEAVVTIASVSDSDTVNVLDFVTTTSSTPISTTSPSTTTPNRKSKESKRTKAVGGSKRKGPNSAGDSSIATPTKPPFTSSSSEQRLDEAAAALDALMGSGGPVNNSPAPLSLGSTSSEQQGSSVSNPPSHSPLPNQSATSSPLIGQPSSSYQSSASSQVPGQKLKSAATSKRRGKSQQSPTPDTTQAPGSAFDGFLAPSAAIMAKKVKDASGRPKSADRSKPIASPTANTTSTNSPNSPIPSIDKSKLSTQSNTFSSISTLGLNTQSTSSSPITSPPSASPQPPAISAHILREQQLQEQRDQLAAIQAVQLAQWQQLNAAQRHQVELWVQHHAPLFQQHRAHTLYQQQLLVASQRERDKQLKERRDLSLKKRKRFEPLLVDPCPCPDCKSLSYAFDSAFLPIQAPLSYYYRTPTLRTSSSSAETPVSSSKLSSEYEGIFKHRHSEADVPVGVYLHQLTDSILANMKESRKVFTCSRPALGTEITDGSYQPCNEKFYTAFELKAHEDLHLAALQEELSFALATTPPPKRSKLQASPQLFNTTPSSSTSSLVGDVKAGAESLGATGSAISASSEAETVTCDYPGCGIKFSGPCSRVNWRRHVESRHLALAPQHCLDCAEPFYTSISSTAAGPSSSLSNSTVSAAASLASFEESLIGEGSRRGRGRPRKASELSVMDSLGVMGLMSLEDLASASELATAATATPTTIATTSTSVTTATAPSPSPSPASSASSRRSHSQSRAGRPQVTQYNVYADASAFDSDAEDEEDRMAVENDESISSPTSALSALAFSASDLAKRRRPGRPRKLIGDSLGSVGTGAGSSSATEALLDSSIGLNIPPGLDLPSATALAFVQLATMSGVEIPMPEPESTTSQSSTTANNTTTTPTTTTTTTTSSSTPTPSTTTGTNSSTSTAVSAWAPNGLPSFLVPHPAAQAAFPMGFNSPLFQPRRAARPRKPLTTSPPSGTTSSSSTPQRLGGTSLSRGDELRRRRGRPPKTPGQRSASKAFSSASSLEESEDDENEGYIDSMDEDTSSGSSALGLASPPNTPLGGSSTTSAASQTKRGHGRPPAKTKPTSPTTSSSSSRLAPTTAFAHHQPQAQPQQMSTLNLPIGTTSPMFGTLFPNQQATLNAALLASNPTAVYSAYAALTDPHHSQHLQALQQLQSQSLVMSQQLLAAQAQLASFSGGFPAYSGLNVASPAQAFWGITPGLRLGIPGGGATTLSSLPSTNSNSSPLTPAITTRPQGAEQTEKTNGSSGTQGQNTTANDPSSLGAAFMDLIDLCSKEIDKTST